MSTAKDYGYQGHQGVAEVEAESVAYIVSAALGLDRSDYSTDYLVGWASGDIEVVRNTAAKVTTVAREILDALGVKGEEN